MNLVTNISCQSFPRDSARWRCPMAEKSTSINGAKRCSISATVPGRMTSRMAWRRSGSVTRSATSTVLASMFGNRGHEEELTMDHTENKASGHSKKIRRMVKINGKWGYINDLARLVIEPSYCDVRPFSEGLAVVWLEPWGA